jgi:uroporphyrinogen-III synthase
MSGLPFIVSTRKLSSEKLPELYNMGWKFLCHDFISKVIHIPENLNPQAISKHIVLTSITGVKSFLQLTGQLNLNVTDYSVYCISRGTNKYAEASGLLVKATAPSASALADEILKEVAVTEVTHISSNVRRDELSDKLAAAGVHVHEIATYRTEFTPMVIATAYDGIIFFSPSAIDSFLSRNSLEPVPCFCIGATTGNHARQKGYQNIYLAEAPSEDFLLKTIIEYYLKYSMHVKK